MIDHYICAVPEAIWEVGRPHNTTVWESSFNLMAWVDAHHAKGHIELLVQHSDACGDHYTRVDSVRVTQPKSHLLSSQIRLRFNDRVTAVRVMLRMANGNMRYHLEELWIQPQDLSQPPTKLVDRGSRPAASNDFDSLAAECRSRLPTPASGCYW